MGNLLNVFDLMYKQANLIHLAQAKLFRRGIYYVLHMEFLSGVESSLIFKLIHFDAETSFVLRF